MAEPKNANPKGIYKAHIGSTDGAKSRVDLGAAAALLDILKQNGSTLAEEAIKDLNNVD